MKVTKEKNYNFLDDWKASYESKEEEIKYRTIFYTQNVMVTAVASTFYLTILLLTTKNATHFGTCTLAPLNYLIFVFFSIVGMNLPDFDELKATAFKGLARLDINWYFTRPRERWHSLAMALKFSFTPLLSGIIWLVVEPNVLHADNPGGWEAFRAVFFIGLLSVGSGLMFGYVLHLYKDSFDDLGVMFLYPFSKKRFTFKNEPYNIEKSIHTYKLVTATAIVMHLLLMIPLSYRFAVQFWLS